MKRKAFTLIELLVVIAIITLLLAILMPALQRVKKQARDLICRSNLKEYGVAGRMYLDDNNGNFPNASTWLCQDYGLCGCGCHDQTKNLVFDPDRAGSMWPYLKNIDVHMCPEFDIIYRMMGCSRCDGTTIPIEPQYSYSMNSYLNGDAWNSVPEQFKANHENVLNEAQVVNPQRVFWFSEENPFSIPGLSGGGTNDNVLRSSPSDKADCFATYHMPPSGDIEKGFANAVFVDSHVERVSAYPAGNTFVLSWPSGPPILDWSSSE